MKRFIGFAALGLVLTAPTLATEGQVIRMGDSALDCTAIIKEANQAAEVLGGSPEGGVFTSEQAIGAATALGQQAALVGGAAKALGGIGAVGGFFGRQAKAREEEQAARRDAAESRWYYLNGLYAGRQCDQVLAEQGPAAEEESAAVVDADPVE